MQEYKLTTSFYRYRPYAKALIALYVVLTLVTLYLAMNGTGIYLALFFLVCLGPPLVAAVWQKSIFNIRSWDDRKLVITYEYIQVGDVKYSWVNIEAVGLYLGGYQGFRHKIMRGDGYESAYGDDNVLSFRYQGTVQSYDFFLRDFDSYVAICHIVDHWKESGKSFALKQAFTRDYIRGQIREAQKTS